MHHLTQTEIQKSLKHTRLEAGPSAFMNGLTEQFMVPYALALGATAPQAGLLGAVRNAILSLAQLKSADAVRYTRSRKKLVLLTATVQAALWVPTAFVAPLFGTWAVPALIFLYTLGTTSAAFGAPAWGSLVSDYLAPNRRGRFFGKLGRTHGIAMLTAGFLAGGLLQRFSHQPLYGFALICLAAALSRVISCVLLGRLREGPLQQLPDENFSIIAFLKRWRTSNFVRFTVTFAAFSLAVNVASLYFSVYLLRELHFPYLTYTLITLSGSICGLLSVPIWGHLRDQVGNYRILRRGMPIIALMPLLWPLWPHPVWLFLTNSIGGTVWGGINLAATNFVYDSATSGKRTRCLAYFNAINGCGISIGMLAGGWLLVNGPWQPAVAYTGLFICSGLLRFAAVLGFRGLVHETRPGPSYGMRQALLDMAGQRLVNVLGFFSTQPLPRNGKR